MKSPKFFTALASVIGLSLSIITLESSFFKIKPVHASHCGFLDPTCSHNGCSDLDPTCNPNLKPITKPLAEQAWGEAGSSAYQAAANVTRGRNGGSQRLDESQKRYLRPHFGDLVDRVAIIYNARMMDQWSAFGKEINLSGVDTAAQTYCNRIYVRDSYKSDDSQQLRTLAHEMTHSKQCEQLGGEGKFGFHYFREFKRAGQNYENNKLEREAYTFENQFVSWLQNQSQNRVGYFDDGGTVFYSNGTSYCGFVSPKHLEFSQKVNQAPSLGRQNPSSFGTNRGVCQLASGYFDNGATVFFSAGNGTFCGFPNPPALDSHRRSRPQQPSFGRIDIDPNRFMSYTGVCQ
jgi:hypothetical protein